MSPRVLSPHGLLLRVAFLSRRTSPQVRARDDPRIMKHPEVLLRAAVAVELLLMLLVALSRFWDAPLEGLGNPMQTPNPAKAPWYFLGLQELLPARRGRCPDSDHGGRRADRYSVFRHQYAGRTDPRRIHAPPYSSAFIGGQLCLRKPSQIRLVRLPVNLFEHFLFPLLEAPFFQMLQQFHFATLYHQHL